MASEARRKAWETRRQKYGPSGHSETAYGWRKCGPASPADIEVILGRLARGELTEGQASRAAGLSRIQIRTLFDERSEA